MRPLSECGEGDTGMIVAIRGTGIIRKRLLDMGFMRGASVTVIKYAPLKDPMEVLVKGFHASLRISEATLIMVTPGKDRA